MSVRRLVESKGGAVVSVRTGQDVAAAVRLMMEHGVGTLPVVDGEGALVGLLSERDVVQAVDRSPLSVRHLLVDQVMRRPAPTCEPEEAINEVMARMTRQRLRHLVVMDRGRIAGVLSVGDLVKHRLEQLELETGVLRDYVAAQRAGGR